MIITQIFVEVDDFMKEYELKVQENMLVDGANRIRRGQLPLSEVMSILIFFYISGYRNFKHYYIRHIQKYYNNHFPDLVSYNRFVELIPRVLLPLSAYAKCSKIGSGNGISFIDSTLIRVCHNKRIHNHKVFDKLATRGKNSVGWYYGFKLHLIINAFGEVVNFVFSKANVDDRNEKIIKTITQGLKGKLVGKGYISQKLSSMLYENGIQLITKIKKNMQEKSMDSFDKLLLQKRGLIETVNDQLKNIYQLEHTRHRSPVNAMVN